MSDKNLNAGELNLREGGTLRFRMVDMKALRWSIYPFLQFTSELSFSPPRGRSESSLLLTGNTIRVSVIDPSWHGPVYLGKAIDKRIVESISPGKPKEVSYDVTIDHYGLQKVEQLRNGGDLELRLEFWQRYTFETVSDEDSLEISYPVEKSKWVEKVLPEVGFKDSHLIEIPKLPRGEFSEVVGHLESAWSQFSMGSYDKTLVHCRKALESLTETTKKIGSAREVPLEDGSKVPIPDFGKILGSERLGEDVQTIFSKLRSVLAPGAHTGKAINREDADFALMCVHAIVNLAIRRMSG